MAIDTYTHNTGQGPTNEGSQTWFQLCGIACVKWILQISQNLKNNFNHFWKIFAFCST
jgi:hypothetical protein